MRDPRRRLDQLEEALGTGGCPRCSSGMVVVIAGDGDTDTGPARCPECGRSTGVTVVVLDPAFEGV